MGRVECPIVNMANPDVSLRTASIRFGTEAGPLAFRRRGLLETTVVAAFMLSSINSAFIGSRRW
jgi:hypothetical protein